MELYSAALQEVKGWIVIRERREKVRKGQRKAKDTG